MTEKELALRQAEQDRDRHYENAITWKNRALSAESRLGAVERAARLLLATEGLRCNVCTGHSPAWDGHDKNPPCEFVARADLRAELDNTDGCSCGAGPDANVHASDCNLWSDDRLANRA